MSSTELLLRVNNVRLRGLSKEQILMVKGNVNNGVMIINRIEFFNVGGVIQFSSAQFSLKKAIRCFC